MLSTPPPVPAYKAQVAAICRANTPSLKVYSQRIVDAQQQNDATASLLNYRLALGVGLAQDTAIYAVPVPPAAKSRMTPILAKLRAQDPLTRQAITAAKNGDGLTLQLLVSRIDVLGKAANRLFDAFGMPDCGSRQS